EPVAHVDAGHADLAVLAEGAGFADSGGRAAAAQEQKGRGARLRLGGPRARRPGARRLCALARPGAEAGRVALRGARMRQAVTRHGADARSRIDEATARSSWTRRSSSTASVRLAARPADAGASTAV